MIACFVIQLNHIIVGDKVRFAVGAKMTISRQDINNKGGIRTVLYAQASGIFRC